VLLCPWCHCWVGSWWLLKRGRTDCEVQDVVRLVSLKGCFQALGEACKDQIWKMRRGPSPPLRTRRPSNPHTCCVPLLASPTPPAVYPLPSGSAQSQHPQSTKSRSLFKTPRRDNLIGPQLEWKLLRSNELRRGGIM
jgi:hypothetical protein